MKVGLIAVDSKYPNLALMKVTRYHREKGDEVEWYTPFEQYDKVYVAKVFSFTEDFGQVIANAHEVVRGGTGYCITSELPDYIDRMQPDYSIYPSIDERTAYGFLTRGCPNHCKWCVVPEKEGGIRPYMDVEEIAIGGRDHLILMDNNVLASDYGLAQIEKIADLGLRVDFNQALDARLVTDEVAKLLARVKWIRHIRFGCDTRGQIRYCDEATDMINRYGFKGEYFFYCILLGKEEECLARINHWRDKGGRYIPYCQPYRDPRRHVQLIPRWQKDIAGWCNRREIFQRCKFEDYNYSQRKKQQTDKRQLELFKGLRYE